MEVKNNTVPILVCPNRNIPNIARPDTISAPGGNIQNTQMDKQTDRSTELLNLPSAQSIEGKVLEGD